MPFLLCTIPFLLLLPDCDHFFSHALIPIPSCAALVQTNIITPQMRSCSLPHLCQHKRPKLNSVRAPRVQTRKISANICHLYCNDGRLNIKPPPPPLSATRLRFECVPQDTSTTHTHTQPSVCVPIKTPPEGSLRLSHRDENMWCVCVLYISHALGAAATAARPHSDAAAANQPAGTEKRHNTLWDACVFSVTECGCIRLGHVAHARPLGVCVRR